MSMIRASFSVANKYVHPQTASDYGCHTFSESACFVYCLLRKIKQGTSLPLVVQWDEYVLAIHLKIPPIAGGEFPSGTRLLAALNKIGSSYLKRKFQRDDRRFLQFTNSVLSFVAARSKIRQGLKCCCTAVNIG